MIGRILALTLSLLLAAGTAFAQAPPVSSTPPAIKGKACPAHQVVTGYSLAAGFSCAALSISDLPASGVSAGAYGDSSHVAQVTFNAQGQATLAAAVSISPAAIGALVAGNNLSDLVTPSAARTNLGLGSIATQAASAVAITGGTIDGTPIGGTTKATGGFTTVAATGQITSTVTTGTAPFVVASATLVANLYAARAALADTVTTNANLTGDVTSSGNATTIGSGKVTNSMLAGSIAASKLIGTDIATVGTLTAGATGAGFTVALATSTLTGALPAANMLALATNSIYQGNGSNQPASVTMSAAIDAAVGSTRGSILRRGASGWEILAPGTATQVLTSNGAGADPTYQPVVGGGTVSSGLAGQNTGYAANGTTVVGSSRRAYLRASMYAILGGS